MGKTSSLLTSQIRKTSFRAYTPYGYIWRTLAPKDLVISYKGPGPVDDRKLFVHYERKTLYGMKLHVDGQDWNNSWLLGLENATDQYLGISEAYSQDEPDGYDAFQNAVNQVLIKLDKKNKLSENKK